MRQIRFNRWHAVKALLTVGLIVFCTGVWPGYLIHTYQVEALFTSDIAEMQWLSTGDVVQQLFSPVHGRLAKIRAAVEFDESAAEEEYLNFTLWDENEKHICNKKIYFNQIESGHYFDITVNKKLDPQKEYVWTLTLGEPTDLQYAVLCTYDIDGNAQENHTLLINGEDTGSNAVNMYEYYAHYDKAVILGGFWTGAALVWLLLLELTDRAEGFFERKKNGAEDKGSEEI